MIDLYCEFCGKTFESVGCTQEISGNSLSTEGVVYGRLYDICSTCDNKIVITDEMIRKMQDDYQKSMKKFRTTFKPKEKGKDE